VKKNYLSQLCLSLTISGSALTACVDQSANDQTPAADDGLVEGELVSVHTRQVVAAISDALVIGPDVAVNAADFQARAETVARDHLRYTVGFLNGRNGAPSLKRTVIKSVVRVAVAGPGLAQYRYSAELDIMLGRDPTNDTATSLEFLLPSQVDTAFLTSFVERYKTDCVSNLRDKPTIDTYWYYYRPEAFFCPLTKTPKPADISATTRVKATLTTKPDGPVTFPEYDAVWRDGTFQYTGLFMQVEGAFGDIGRESYGSTIRDMTAEFGQPTIVYPPNLTLAKLTQQIRASNVVVPELVLKFNSPKGPVEARMFLLASLETPDTSVPDFAKKYETATERADLVVFSGHASYGRDVERFSKMGKFAAGQYQLFVLNACDSFAYEAPDLRDAHSRINAAASNPSGFFDLMVNAMPAPAQEIPAVTLSFVKALAQAKLSYQEILTTINSEQRAVVLYDEDNQWGRTTPTNPTVRVENKTGTFTLTGQQQNFGPFKSINGLTAAMTGTGDVDLYVRKGAAPTKTTYDCRPFASNANESCVGTGTGDFYVSLINVKPASSFTLRLEYTK
jgi:hypothetical protein